MLPYADGKRDFAVVIKDLDVGRLSLGAQCNHKCLYKRDAGGIRIRKKDVTMEPEAAMRHFEDRRRDIEPRNAGRL